MRWSQSIMPQCAVPIPHLMTRQTDRQQYGMLLLPRDNYLRVYPE